MGLADLKRSRWLMRLRDSGEREEEKEGTWPVGMCNLDALLIAERRMVSVLCGFRSGGGIGEMSASRESVNAAQCAFL